MRPWASRRSRVGERRSWLPTLAAAGALAAPACAYALVSDSPAPLRAEDALGAHPARGAQSGVRPRLVPRVRLSATLVKRGRTRIHELDIASAPADARVTLACSGGGCPSQEQLSQNPTEPERFGAVMAGRRLSAGAKLVVGTTATRELRTADGAVISFEVKYATSYVMRRGALPRRADSCEALGQTDCIDPSIVGLFRVQGPVTRIARLRVTGVAYDQVFRFSCRGRSCPSDDLFYAERPSGVDFTGWFSGATLAPGTKITVGYVAPDRVTVHPGIRPTLCAATQWTIRRGAAPRRVDIGPYEGEDPAVVRRACRRPFR